MTQKQIIQTILYVAAIIMGIFVPYNIGMWVSGGNDSCVIGTWIVGFFTMVVVATGVGIGVIAYNFLKK